jgi:hypothetical protein
VAGGAQLDKPSITSKSGFYASSRVFVHILDI